MKYNMTEHIKNEIKVEIELHLHNKGLFASKNLFSSMFCSKKKELLIQRIGEILRAIL